MLNTLTWLHTSIRRRIRVPYVIDRDPDYRKTTFLAGTARSGTTWVSELLNFQNDYRYIFEPFYPKRVPLAAPVGHRRYLRPGDVNRDVFSIAEHVLTGKIRHPWTERFNRRFVTDERLVKDVRANLLLKWLQNNFPGMPMVLVLRHPCAVAHSYVKHGWHATTDTLLAQPALLEDFLEPHREAMAGAADAFERALFIWSIETLVPLKQFRPDELHVVFYEQLVDEPETEIPRLFAFLKKPYDASALASVTRPSRTSRRDSAVATGENVTRSWLAKIDAARVRRAREIVTRFGLDGLYSETGRPNPAALRALMAG